MATWQKDRAWKQQKIYVVKSVVLGIFLVPGLRAVYVFSRYILGPLFLLFSLPAIIIGFVYAKSLLEDKSFFEVLKDYVTIIPYKYVEKESYFEKRLNATYALILINVLIHYGILLAGTDFQDLIFEYLSFFPDRWHLWNLVISPFACIFLHADADHLWGNMLFLWIFGLTLEKRIGWKKFLLIYFATGLVSSIFPVYLEIILNQELLSAIGASGAIMGVTGAFAVRLFYKRITFPVPFLGILSFLFGLYLKIKMNSLVLISSYFITNLLSGISSLSRTFSDVDYWGHVGGFVAGVILAARLRLDERAAEDIMMERALTAINLASSNQEAERYLNYVLEMNPKRVEALVNLARIKKKEKKEEESRQFYLKAMDVLLESEPEKAAELFAEYFANFRRPLPVDKQFRLNEVLIRTGLTDLAARSLEILDDDPATPESQRPHILYRAARLLEKLEAYEAACFRYEQLLSRYPDFPEVEKIKYKIERLKSVSQDYSWATFIKRRRDMN